MGEKSQVMLSVDIPLPGLYGITPHLISGHGSYVPIWLPGFDDDGDKTGETVFMIMFDLVTPRKLPTFISTFAREKKKISRQGEVVKRITDATFTGSRDLGSLLCKYDLCLKQLCLQRNRYFGNFVRAMIPTQNHYDTK